MIAESILQGRKVRLRPVEESDLSLFVRWFNDPEVRYWLGISEEPELSMDSERGWYEEMRGDLTRIVWVIQTMAGWAIGNVELRDIDETHGRAALGIAIGEKEYWSRGYGTDAVKQVLRYAFEEMELRRVELYTDEDNVQGIRCYEKCGFEREGLLRARRLRQGQPVNCLIMAVLRKDR